MLFVLIVLTLKSVEKMSVVIYSVMPTNFIEVTAYHQVYGKNRRKVVTGYKYCNSRHQ